MKFFDFEIMGLKRKLPYVQVGENLALASFVVLSDTELIQTVAPELLKRLPEVDVLMTAEAKGICLTYELSRLMGMKDFVVARKSRKPYMQNPVSHSVRSVTTQKEQHLWLDGCEAEKLKGKRVALIDDVIATGESLEALETLAKSAGANIVARAAILAELESVHRTDIIYLKEHYVFRPNPPAPITRTEPLKYPPARRGETGSFPASFSHPHTPRPGVFPRAAALSPFPTYRRASGAPNPGNRVLPPPCLRIAFF